MNSINVFQKDWAFTSKNSEKPIIKTASFGPCYVITFTSEKFAAMTHIDDCTNVDSIQEIFNKFSENSVVFKDIKVVILGGWKGHPESFKWGNKVVKKIEEGCFGSVSIKNMYSKNIYVGQGVTLNNYFNHYHLGALVDARNGSTFLLKKNNQEMDRKQHALMIQFGEKYGEALDVELPINQVF